MKRAQGWGAGGSHPRWNERKLWLGKRCNFSRIGYRAAVMMKARQIPIACEKRTLGGRCFLDINSNIKKSNYSI
ncbi:hypothetical protein [Hyphobacterium sp.]|uniref:hypothetical protein n=1 Tax=Hyphobacterium sp. TaxID=2004662 RepID=UPI003BA8EFCA